MNAHIINGRAVVEHAASELTPERAAAREAFYGEGGIASCQRTVHNAIPENKLRVLEMMARDAIALTVKAGFDRIDTIDMLQNLAVAEGIVARHGQDEVQAALARAMAPTARKAADDESRHSEGAPAASDAWNDPDWSLLDDRRGTLPEFPVEVLAPPWREWAELAAHGAGVTTGHVVVPLLAVASSLIGAARRIQASRSWLEPMTLWTAVVGFSGSGKTPGIDVVKRHLAHIERMRRGRIDELQRRHETRAQTAKAAQKKWKKEVEEAIANGMPAPPRPLDAADTGEFVSPRLYISDATIERLAMLLQARERGMLVVADELAGLFLNMGRYSNGSDREFWLEAWNGKSFVVERMGRPAVMVENLLVGITGGLQPDKLARSFERDADGMYARVCFAWPQEPSYKPLTNDIADIEPETVNALCRLIDLDTGDADTFVPRNVPLANEALATFEHFRRFLHAAKSALDGREREWSAKGASHVLRLAGTLSYLEWSIVGGPEPSDIDDRTMTAAVRLWRDYFWPHSRAALRQIGLSERHANARRVLRWIMTQAKTEVGLTDIRREALAQSLDAKQTGDLLDSLTQAGWLKKAIERTGGRPAHRWTVNAALFAGAESARSAERCMADAA